ncbi:MAG: hypothetical protein AABW54_01515 [Candidatus Micrarchaeota archaeon]
MRGVFAALVAACIVIAAAGIHSTLAAHYGRASFSSDAARVLSAEFAVVDAKRSLATTLSHASGAGLAREEKAALVAAWENAIEAQHQGIDAWASARPLGELERDGLMREMLYAEKPLKCEACVDAALAAGVEGVMFGCSYYAHGVAATCG